MDPRPKYMNRANTLKALTRLERELKYVIDKQKGLEWEKQLARDRLATTLDYIIAIGGGPAQFGTNPRREHPNQGPKEGPTNVMHLERPRA